MMHLMSRQHPYEDLTAPKIDLAKLEECINQQVGIKHEAVRRMALRRLREHATQGRISAAEALKQLDIVRAGIQARLTAGEMEDIFESHLGKHPSTQFSLDESQRREFREGISDAETIIRAISGLLGAGN